MNTYTIDARGRMWPVDGARLVRSWNRARLGRLDRWGILERARNARHDMRQNINDYAPRGIVRNREGLNNRRWRKYLKTAPRVIWSCAAFDIVA